MPDYTSIDKNEAAIDHARCSAKKPFHDPEP